MAELRRFLDEDPKLIRYVGNVARRVIDGLVAQHAANSAFIKECEERKLDEMRVELGYEGASPTEKMLIEQVLICWFRLHTLESVHSVKTTESHSSETGLYWDRRLSTAQRRFTRTCESLAKVRKLMSHTRLSDAIADAGRTPTASSNVTPLKIATG
jgi:hypothetical protein